MNFSHNDDIFISFMYLYNAKNQYYKYLKLPLFLYTSKLR